jgi:transcription antitermination factor NusA-like protein
VAGIFVPIIKSIYRIQVHEAQLSVVVLDAGDNVRVIRRLSRTGLVLNI